MKIFRTIIALFQALLSFLAFSFLAVVLYYKFEPPFNTIGGILSISLGLYLSRLVFNMTKRRGIIATLSGDHSTYDIDQLEPSPNDGVSKLNAEELTIIFQENKLNYINGTSVSIWGDQKGRKLDIKHYLDSVSYNSEKEILTITFSDKCFLKVKRPNLILCSSSYLKIVKAKEILWEIPSDSNNNSQFSYLNTGKEIKTKSNIEWNKHSFDVGIGMNALYLQG